MRKNSIYILYRSQGKKQILFLLYYSKWKYWKFVRVKLDKESKSQKKSYILKCKEHGWNLKFCSQRNPIRTGSFRRCSGTSILARSKAFSKTCLWRTALTFFIYKHEVIIIEKMRDQPKNSFCSEYSVHFPCSFKFHNWVKEETECSSARLMLQPLGFLLVTVDYDFLW